MESDSAPGHAPPRTESQLTEALLRLEQLIQRMDSLGAAAEDAKTRIVKALAGPLLRTSVAADRDELVAAIGDVIEIVTERSTLAHEAHRLIVEIRRGDLRDSRSLRKEAGVVVQ